MYICVCVCMCVYVCYDLLVQHSSARLISRLENKKVKLLLCC